LEEKEGKCRLLVEDVEVGKEQDEKELLVVGGYD